MERRGFIKTLSGCIVALGTSVGISKAKEDITESGTRWYVLPDSPNAKDANGYGMGFGKPLKTYAYALTKCRKGSFDEIHIQFAADKKYAGEFSLPQGCPWTVVSTSSEAMGNLQKVQNILRDRYGRV